MVITCKFDTGIYRNPSNGYTVAVYSSWEAGKVPKAAIRSEQGSKILFTAVGNGLPCYDGHLEPVEPVFGPLVPNDPSPRAGSLGTRGPKTGSTGSK